MSEELAIKDMVEPVRKEVEKISSKDLMKNPNNQNGSAARPNKPLSKEWRQGVFKLLFINNGVGYDPQLEGEVECRIWLVENPERSSFGGLSLISTDHLASPELYVGLLDKLLRSAYREKEAHDAPCSLQFALKIGEAKLKSFVSHYEALGDNTFWIHECFPSVYEGLNWLLALCFTSMYKGRWDKTNIEKCLSLFSRYSLTAVQTYHLSRSLSQDLAIRLNGYNPNVEIVGGTTELQRFQSYREELSGGNTLYDLGCGYKPRSRHLVSKYKNIVQVDKAYNLKPISNNVVFYKEDIANIEIERGSHVLLSEVIEHNSKDYSFALIESLLNKADKIIITVPNRDFNEVWGGESYRHEDHEWEPTLEELKDFLPKVESHVLSITGIGDKVLLGGRMESISLMAIYTKKQFVTISQSNLKNKTFR